MPRPRQVLAAAGIAIASLSAAASAHDVQHDNYGTHATPYTGNGRLAPDARRALRRFNEQKSRDYQRLGRQHFDSQSARQHAYRQLRRQHCNQLRDILGESRFDEDCFRHHRDDDDRRDDHWDQNHSDRRGARTVDPRTVAASVAARWALSQGGQNDLADVLADYQEDVAEFHQQHFDNPRERREAQRDLQEDYQDDLEDVLDDLSDTDADDILERVLRY